MHQAIWERDGSGDGLAMGTRLMGVGSVALSTIRQLRCWREFRWGFCPIECASMWNGCRSGNRCFPCESGVLKAQHS